MREHLKNYFNFSGGAVPWQDNMIPVAKTSHKYTGNFKDKVTICYGFDCTLVLVIMILFLK